ncbi:hypothetical protein CERZMDRAFT_93695 [Cercospora zeae-maydis SCOH1-5]|uniref:Protection of telomeres protein 1 n=1 Tax=Cercospora zeae-maydis SCOH1-5 TaxID=717836 RepID=A0A6A6FSW6_9PEZI|nr:hypothetical protein CERZMDRAFT_93695 [Cercospora zeae-maydis SCOH1-5]
MPIATPPKGFIDLAAAYKQPEGALVNIIGIVVDFMEPMQTKTGQSMLTFRLLDYRLSMAAEGSQGLTCRSFKKDADSLPRVRSIGDVVMLRNVKMATWEHQRIALTNWSTACLVFPKAAIPNPNFNYAYTKNLIERLGTEKDKADFGLLEQEYVISINVDLNSKMEQLHAKATSRTLEKDDLVNPRPAKRARPSEDYHATVSGFGPKFRLIEDLRTWDFADVVGFVVKCFPTQYGGCDLYITDYTANEYLRHYAPPEEEPEERDGDAFGYSNAPKKSWHGPFGHLVMKINVKPPHAAVAASTLNEGDVVLLRNVKRRTSPGEFLEGDMWPDHQDDKKIKVHRIKDTSGPEIQAMFKRKERYWMERDAKLLSTKEPAQQTKSNRKARKREKKKAAAAAAAAAAKVDDIAMNPNIRCHHDEGEVFQSIKQILDVDNVRHTNQTPNGVRYALPFINAKYRACVRVIDYHPQTLEEFVVQAGLNDSMHDPDACYYEASPKYEWAFSLLLEEAGDHGKAGERPSLWVHVHHEQAQYLFRDLPDPDDLRHRHGLLHQLREKLFLLWGNLEEKAEGVALSNVPFQCCIEEYGIEVDEPASALTGYQRMYSMFGTSIL